MQNALNREKLAIVLMKLGKLVDTETAIVKGIGMLKHIGEADQKLYIFYYTLGNCYCLQERLLEAEPLSYSN